MAVLQDLLDVQRRLNQQLCLSFNEAHQEMVATLKVTRQEKRKRLAIKRELGELKEFTKLKGMVRLEVTSLNLQNNRFPTKDVQDVFNPQVMEELSSEEEVPQENIVTIPVPGPLMEIPQTLQEIPRSPGPSLRAFLSQPIVIASSIPPLGSSPHTGGEGLWKRVFTCWEHFRLCHKVLPMFRPDTFCSHFKCNLNICLRCDHQ